MKTISKSIILILALSIIILSCKKDENPPATPDDIWTCHNQMSWDSLKTINTLIGEWEWQYKWCLRSPDSNRVEFIGLSVEFKSDNTLDVKEDGQIIQTSNWNLTGSPGLFDLEVDPHVNQLVGLILFCEDRVEFYNSRVDGCDNNFKRKP